MQTKPRGLDSPAAGRFIRWMSRANVWVYRRTGGRVGATWRVGAAFRKPVPILLLEHVGRRSGQVRTTPLVYLEDGDRLVVVASQGGRPEHPQWYRNLLADPDVRVQQGRRSRRLRARVADEEERRRLWPRLVGHYADFASYQSWTDRQIPVVLLETPPPG